jgi:hypothetical protein
MLEEYHQPTMRASDPGYRLDHDEIAEIIGARDDPEASTD